MRILTAGESHGEYLSVIIEGFPSGVHIEQDFINQELKRRMSGFGRGKRMFIEDDKVEIVSGLRNKITLGSPIAILVKNKDVKIFPQNEDNLPSLKIPRPAHADLAGAIKYREIDIRNILERASARETVSRVCAGAVCKQFLSNFCIDIASFTVSVGGVYSHVEPRSVADIINKTRKSELNCIDKKSEKLMIKAIEEAQSQKDTLGGVVEIWIEGLPAGLGTFMHFDKRLDAILSFYLMSIPAIKGVEIGLGFDYAKQKGSKSHDEIYYSDKNGFYRDTNNSGGIEGGVSTGEPVVMRMAMKPIATLRKPLSSVNITNKKKEKAIVERSDTCAVAACGVIGENMSAIAITESFFEKFGCDSFIDIKTAYNSYIKNLDNL